MFLKEKINDISKKNNVGGCDRCHSKHPKFRRSMTAYSTVGMNMDIEGDPNGDVFLCDMCYEEYVQYWEEMWDEYNRSR